MIFQIEHTRLTMASGTGRNPARGRGSHSFQIKQEVHTMMTRYEIEVTRLEDGRLYLRAFDEYWDGVKTEILDTASKSPTLKGDAALIAALKPVLNKVEQFRAGCWYALQMPKDAYPFGTPTHLERIPGRHKVYKKL